MTGFLSGKPRINDRSVTLAKMAAGTAFNLFAYDTNGNPVSIGDLPVSQGGTGASTASGARTALGVALGSDVQGYDVDTSKTDVVESNTGTKTFAGTSSTLGSVFVNVAEKTIIVASAATGTINFYAATQSVLLYTSNATANWTVNVAMSSGTTLNAALAIGQSLSVTFMATQGGTAYYNNVFKVDGNINTPKWLGGPPNAGTASGIDVYTYTITKTASNVYSVLAAVSSFS